MKWVGIVLLALVLPVQAADLSTKKAPTSSIFSGYPANSGCYFGANGALGQSKVDGVVQSTSVGVVTAATGDVGLTLGCVWAQSGLPVWYAVEGTFDYSNINGQNGFFSLSGPLNFSQVFLLGAPWDAITSVLPNWGIGPFPGIPALPNGVTAGAGQLYLFAGVKELDISSNFGFQSFREWEIGPILGPGVRALLSNKTAVDVRFEYQPPLQTRCVGPIQTCSGINASYTIRTSVDF